MRLAEKLLCMLETSDDEIVKILKARAKEFSPSSPAKITVEDYGVFMSNTNSDYRNRDGEPFANWISEVMDKFKQTREYKSLSTTHKIEVSRSEKGSWQIYVVKKK